jgi:hypothetical protein
MNAGTQATCRFQPSHRGQNELEVAPRSSHRPRNGSETMGTDTYARQPANMGVGDFN